ncbi:P27 family phage terminase small subunit [Myroides sp. JBRI-B21084]|uniref:P27 family phage terminase small subunit n=1 Tax=Myroides sp. JBRI-B21084 TaxID=3119977 RepID=UPI0026E1CBED|nr:P27 family phage terminase small subunit [Paenimyroides cloacae]WKW47281.1 P27 family phage terminase small subunit [Paenimyroides cloacae]
METVHRKEISFQPEKIEHLTTVPEPPTFLSNPAKKHYKTMGEKLVELNRLKKVYLNALEIFAEAMAQFEFATKQIHAKNREEFGTGYIQTYRTKATNISTEVVLRNDAASTLLKCFKQFGLDPRSERELKGVENVGQLDIFTEFFKEHA